MSDEELTPQPDNEAEAQTDPADGVADAGVPVGDAAPAGDEPQALSFDDFSSEDDGAEPSAIDLISDVQLDVSIELGRTRMLVEDVLRLGQGAVVELDKLAGDPVDVYVNERLIARGEVLVMNDNFSIRVNEILDIAAIEEIQRRQRPAG